MTAAELHRGDHLQGTMVRFVGAAIIEVQPVVRRVRRRIVAGRVADVRVRWVDGATCRYAPDHRLDALPGTAVA